MTHHSLSMCACITGAHTCCRPVYQDTDAMAQLQNNLAQRIATKSEQLLLLSRSKEGITSRDAAARVVSPTGSHHGSHHHGLVSNGLARAFHHAEATFGHAESSPSHMMLFGNGGAEVKAAVGGPGYYPNQPSPDHLRGPGEHTRQ